MWMLMYMYAIRMFSVANLALVEFPRFSLLTQQPTPHGPHRNSVNSGSEHDQFNSPRLVKCEVPQPTAQTNYDALTHWGRGTHLYVGNLTINGSDNGLSPDRRQTIIWTNAGILLIGHLGTNFSEILINILIFSFKKMHLKVSSAKWRPFCLGLSPGSQCVNDSPYYREYRGVVPQWVHTIMYVYWLEVPHWTHDVIITSLKRQNDVVLT